MNRIMAAVCVLAGLATVAAQAEPMRTILTRENMLPAKGQFEAGLFLGYSEVEDERDLSLDNQDIWDTVPYARYGVTKDFALGLKVPWVNVNSQNDGPDETGLGDLSLSAELRGFEDALGYPFVLPYVDLSLPTGDEDKGLGYGDPVFTFGTAVGTIVDDLWHFTADAGYDIRSEDDNTFHLGGSVVYDVSRVGCLPHHKGFSLLAETIWTEALNDTAEDQMWVIGGMIYKPTPAWMVGVYGGTEVAGGGDNNVLAGLKLAYSFE